MHLFPKTPELLRGPCTPSLYSVLVPAPVPAPVPVPVPVPVVAAQRSTARFTDVADLEPLPLRDAVVTAAAVPNTATMSAVVLLAMLFVVLGGLAYWARLSGVSWPHRDVADGGAILQSGLGEVAPPAAIAPPPEIVPRPVRVAHEPRVLRFSAFPDVVARGESLGLCYEVANGARVRIDPDVGEVGALPRNCVQASPAETTTYVLTAEGEDGAGVRQTVLVRVGLDKSTPRQSVGDRASNAETRLRAVHAVHLPLVTFPPALRRFAGHWT